MAGWVGVRNVAGREETPMPLNLPSRRTVLSGALAGGALAALNAVPASADDTTSRSSVAQAAAFLDTMSSAYPASGSPTLPQTRAKAVPRALPVSQGV